jgi:phosphatidylglycerol lysyltransferase
MSHNDERTRVLDALKRYGYHSQSYNILREGKKYFFSERGIEGVIAYIVQARVALAAGDPVCAPEDIREFADEFRQFCKKHRWRCCFHPVTERCKEVLKDLGFGVMKTGEEPIIDLNKLSWSGGKFKDLRRDTRRAKEQGMSVVEYRPREGRRTDWEEQMEKISRVWSKAKGSREFSFLIGAPSLDNPGERTYLLVLKDDRVEAFMVCTPIYARHGIYFDIMRRKDKPLLGTAQLLISEALQFFKQQEYEIATMGTVPLANEYVEDPDQARIVELALDFTFDHLGHFHHLKPLYQFKEQFGASWWEGRYLTYYSSRFNPVILYAILKAYDPGGVSNQLKKQLNLAWRGIKQVRRFRKKIMGRVHHLV